MRLTTARYYTPSGRSIQSLGVVPDIVVEQRPRVNDDNIETKKVERKRLTESDLKGALENDSLSDDEKKQLEFDIQKQEESIIRRLEDYQIAYALDILKSLSIFQENEDL